MLIRFLVAAALLSAVSSTAFAGTCSCSPEIKNASAVVTGSCSKVWSNSHCTLKESGASTSQLHQQFSGNFSHGFSLLVGTLRQIVGSRAAATELAVRFKRFDYARNSRQRCPRREPVDQSDLVMVLIDPALSFGTKGSIGLLLKPDILSSVIDSVIKGRVADKICRSDMIEKMTFSDGTDFFFGAGCVGYGNSRTYVVTDLGGFGDCFRQIKF